MPQALTGRPFPAVYIEQQALETFNIRLFIEVI